MISDITSFASETQTPLTLIPINQLKAFHCVSHSFSFSTLHHFGFSPKFIRWIKLIYNSVSISVRVNRWLTSFIAFEWGIRQGRALSIPLYVLTAEILALRIRNNPLIKRTFQCVDDTTFMLHDDNSIKELSTRSPCMRPLSEVKLTLKNLKVSGLGLLAPAPISHFSLNGLTHIPEKILGLFFGNVDCTKLNIKRHLQLLRHTIAAWEHRELSFKGKSSRNKWPLTSTLCYTATIIHLPPWAITEIEQEVYNFFWHYKKLLTTRDILALPLFEGGFNIHRIHTKIQALRLNTHCRLISPQPAHWKHFTAYFIGVQHLQLGLYTFTLDYKTQHIHPSIPAYHRKLLITWNKHGFLRQRILDPRSLTDILQEPIFANPLTQLDNRPLDFPAWILAGLTLIQNLSYIAFPGVLPPQAIHELLHNLEPDPLLQSRTTHELYQILQAIPHS